VRDIVLSALMGNTNFLADLFTSIEAGGLPAWTVNAERRQSLMKHKDESFRQRATRCSKRWFPATHESVRGHESVLSLAPDSKNAWPFSKRMRRLSRLRR